MDSGHLNQKNYSLIFCVIYTWVLSFILDSSIETYDRQQQLLPDQAGEAQTTADEDGWGVENQGKNKVIWKSMILLREELYCLK